MTYKRRYKKRPIWTDALLRQRATELTQSGKPALQIVRILVGQGYEITGSDLYNLRRKMWVESRVNPK